MRPVRPLGGALANMHTHAGGIIVIIGWQAHYMVWQGRPFIGLQFVGRSRDTRSERLWCSAWLARATWLNSLSRLWSISA